MRWIDIILPETTIHREFDTHLAAAATLAAEITGIQQKYGLDSTRVLEFMTRAGQELFQGIISVDPEAFSPTRATPQSTDPVLGEPGYDELLGYHIVASGNQTALPWTWLHNGVAFLYEKHPVCTATHGSRLPSEAARRPWMQRLQRAGFLVGSDGGTNVLDTFVQLRPGDVGRPEVLFVPGHTDRERRKLIYREAELIEGALEHGCRGETLLDLDFPLEPVTPSDLIAKGLQYQAIHFAGPVSKPARSSDPFGEYWMDRLIEETNPNESHELDDALGLEGEVLGVDPVTSLLDDIVERYETTGLAEKQVSVPVGASSEAGSGSRPGDHSPAPDRKSWLLDDGPVMPEHLERGGALPPLVFSNSYQALPALGQRFIRAGASTFIGPLVPLFSRPARIFAGHCYGSMGEGWNAGAAVWKAAQVCRKELGATHPAWLSYGVQGYGKLALQYL